MSKILSLILAGILALTTCLSSSAEPKFTVFKQVEVPGARPSLYMEVLVDKPSRAKLTELTDYFLAKYGKRKGWIQIDIFDNPEALRRRGDERYPTKLVHKYWLVSITEKGVHRFFEKERPEIK